MAGYAGFDSSGFPGQAQMDWLAANTNLVWCGYYLAPAPSHGNAGWMGQRAALADGGWGMAPIFVGQELRGPGSHHVTEAFGTSDGTMAAALMRAEGFSDGACVYLDLEDGPPLSAPRTAYIGAWVDAVAQAGFTPGVYGSHLIAGSVHALRPDARIWAYRVTTTASHPVPGTNFPDLHPAGSGYVGAYAWQLAQNCRLALPGAPKAAMVVDLDTAVTADPSAA